MVSESPVLRSLIEQSTRNISFRRSLPPSLGGAPIYVSPSAGLRYLFRPMDQIDPVLRDMAQEFIHRGHVVWDIGANVGLFSFIAAHLAGSTGKIFALEPDVWLVQLLRRSATHAPPSSAPVHVIAAAAAADSVALRTLHIAARSRSANFLEGYGLSQTGGVAEQHLVVALSLDWLAQNIPPPDVLKIDVEGAEFEVLSGAVGLLEQKRPVILCEVCSERSQAVTALLQDHGYRIYDADTPKAQRKELDRAPWNTIAVPARAARPASVP